MTAALDLAPAARAAWRVSPLGYGIRLSDLKRWRHSAAISRAFVETTQDKAGGRLIVTVPPQYGKSEIVSVHGPAWALDHHPRKRLVIAGYEHNFARRWGGKVRDLIANHPDEFRVRVTGGTRAAAGEWTTTAGGGLFCTGIGGPLTGRGADGMIIDDPFKNWAEAASPTIRDNVWEWWRSVARTRLQPGAWVVVCMTRWHEDDLVGRLTNPAKNPDAARWRVLRLPALAEEPDDRLPGFDPTGRQPGEPLEPRRYSLEEVQSLTRDLGPYLAAGMLQQRPSPEEGGVFKRSWWRYYDRMPQPHTFDLVWASWDMAFKDTATSSYVVGQVWGLRDADRFLLDQVRGRMGWLETKAAVSQLHAKWPRAVPILVEDKANGPAILAELGATIPGLEPFSPGQDSKYVRALSISGYVSAGNVWLPSPELADWVLGYVEEHANFPNATNDDQVDATSQALRWLANRMEAAGGPPGDEYDDHRLRGRR